MSELLYVLTGLLVGGLGAGVGVTTLIRRRQASGDQVADTKVADAEKKASKILAQAEVEAEKRRQSLLKEAEERQTFLRDLEKTLQSREGSLDKRLAEVERTRLDWEKKNEEMLQIKEAVREVRERQEASLERIAKMTREAP
jgi:ribonuclease Y